MRKNIERILGAASIVIAFVLTVILLVTVFGGIEQSEFDNNLVKGLFITLAVLYFVLAGGLLAMLFGASDAVKEITLRSEQGGSCKATLGIIRKLVKESFRDIPGVKTGKVTLVVNEFGVKLRVSVKITDRDVFETETYLRTLLEETFAGALGFRFHTIEFRVVEFRAKFKPDAEKIDAEVREKVEAHTPNYASIPGAVEQKALVESDEETTAAAEEETLSAEADEAESAADETPAIESEEQPAADAEEEEISETSEDTAAEDAEADKDKREDIDAYGVDE
ncbi:MAG TPA: hypothetical protein IAC73_05475 [Candidatus Limadaptatus stercoripullorum]|uniref:Uncharacterized protein n=1 Tax=Candidatus Limadaptatus stercoripullorum TaxID=2840846 RepID=A0A9D1SW39_9FIRM|nr:hypothetical protein [Candidatus Limadaptatus stercoripullorum]